MISSRTKFGNGKKKKKKESIERIIWSNSVNML